MIISADLKAGRLKHRCPACGTVSSINTDGLELGVSFGGLVNPDLIRLPACSCGRAMSFLVRTWDDTPPGFQGTAHDLQRRAVNALAQVLKAAGKSQTDAKAIHDAEKAPPPELAALDAPLVVRAASKVAPAPTPESPPPPPVAGTPDVAPAPPAPPRTP